MYLLVACNTYGSKKIIFLSAAHPRLTCRRYSNPAATLSGNRDNRPARQRLLQRARCRNGFTPPIPPQQFVGAPGQHSPYFSALTPDLRNHHAVIASCLVAHPRSHRGRGPLLNRNTLGPGHRAADDKHGVGGDGAAQLPRHGGLARHREVGRAMTVRAVRLR
jgi:hypothetical protein